jgi:hypothetical protein
LTGFVATFLCDIEKHRRYPNEELFEKLINLFNLRNQREYLFLKMLSEKNEGQFKEIILHAMQGLEWQIEQESEAD